MYLCLGILMDGVREETRRDLEGKADYLPVNFNKLDREEKIGWLEKEFGKKLGEYKPKIQNFNMDLSIPQRDIYIKEDKNNEPIIVFNENGIPTIQKDKGIIYNLNKSNEPIIVFNEKGIPTIQKDENMNVRICYTLDKKVCDLNGKIINSKKEDEKDSKLVKKFLGESACYLLNKKSHLLTWQEQDILKDVLFNYNNAISFQKDENIGAGISYNFGSKDKLKDGVEYFTEKGDKK